MLSLFSSKHLVTFQWIVCLAVDLSYLDVPLVVENQAGHGRGVGQAAVVGEASADHGEQSNGILSNGGVHRQINWNEMNGSKFYFYNFLLFFTITLV